jgi:hypothetical protein
MAAMRRTYLTLLVVVALFGLGAVTSCIVRSGPGRGRGAYPVSTAHHKHEKGPKKHKH